MHEIATKNLAALAAAAKCWSDHEAKAWHVCRDQLMHKSMHWASVELGVASERPPGSLQDDTFSDAELVCAPAVRSLSMQVPG